MTLTILALAATLTATEAQSSSDFRIPHVDAQVRVDGELDEPFWAEALVVELGYETQPGENIPARVKTEALLVDSGSALLVGFRAHDPDPAAIRAYLHDRDAAWNDDWVGIVLDTFNDERRALEFFANPFGAQMDLTNDDILRREDSSWDAIWGSAGRITDFGYQVEMEIPYTALQLPNVDGLQTWGIDLIRNYPRNERYRLSNNPRDRGRSCYLCQLAKFDGFETAEPGRDLEITPTLTATSSRAREDLGGELESLGSDFEPGLDVSWGITPNITFNGTLNPDFSQVEADVAQLDVNNTFTLFFPEKRPFFLENAGIFGTPIRTVFTRNVADPDIGLRLTGKVDAHAFGAFVADDTVTNFLVPGSLGSGVALLDRPSENAAIRYRHDVGENSALGVVATRRQADDYSNTVAGIDGRLRLTENDTLIFQYLDSQTEYPASVVEEFDQASGELSGSAIEAEYLHTTRDWFSYTRYEDFDEDFRADLGFVGRVDFKRWIQGGGYIWHGDDTHWYNRLELSGDWDITHDQSGQLLERELEAYAHFNGARQSYARLGGGTRDRYWDGTLYDETFYHAFGELQPRAGMYLGLGVSWGDQIDFANSRLAEQLSLRPSLRFNLGRHAQVRVRHTYQALDYELGDIYTANQSDVRFSYQFDLRQRLKLTLQYTDIDRNPAAYLDEVDASYQQLGTQLIYSYKVNPRTLVFAGYSDLGVDTDAVEKLITTDRTLFFKLSYAWEPTF